MSLVRCVSSFLLFFIACLAPLRLCADTLVSLTVRTDSPGGGACLLGSTGGQIQCVSGSLTSPPVAEATASGSAAVGVLSLFVEAGTTGGGLAVAGGTVSYDAQLLLLAGTPSETIVGKYMVYTGASGDYAQFGNINLAQGSSTVSIPIEEPAEAIPNPLVISSAYAAGQPFVISGSMLAEASSSGSSAGGSAPPALTSEQAGASIELLGFTDPQGNPVPFTVAPEPATWPVVGACLFLLGWGKRIRWGAERRIR